MQTQSGSAPGRQKPGEGRRARQAAGLREDVFGGGVEAAPRSMADKWLRRPWRPATARLWPGAGPTDEGDGQPH